MATPAPTANAPPNGAPDELKIVHPLAEMATMFFRNYAAVAGLILLMFIVLFTFVGPYLHPIDPFEMVWAPFSAPGEEGFLFGTDYLGRDILSRLLYGARLTLGVSLAATLIAYFVGVTLGVAAAVGGSTLDAVLSRINDAFLSLPTIMLGLIIIAAVGSTIPILIITAGLIYASSVFRIARALALDVMVSDFVEAARARGEGLWWVITREILPNIAMPLATDFGLRLVFVILFVSSLSFLGLGVQPPAADWGSMVRENLAGLSYGSIAPIAPAIAIATLTIGINLIVDDVSAWAGGKLASRMV